METVATAGAGAAIVSPWWLPALHDINAGAAWLLPLLGCTLLTLQILRICVTYFLRNRK